MNIVVINEDLKLLNEVIEDIKYKLKRHVICDKYRKNNKEKVTESKTKYQEKNRERIRINQKNRRKRVRIEKGLDKFSRPLDKNSPFKRIYDNVKKSKNGCFITIDDIREQYEKQNGLCALSNLTLLIPRHSGIIIRSPYKMSVDRIDSNKPYIKDNIQLVCLSLNYAKNTFSDNDIRDFIKKLSSK